MKEKNGAKLTVFYSIREDLNQLKECFTEDFTQWLLKSNNTILYLDKTTHIWTPLSAGTVTFNCTIKDTTFQQNNIQYSINY